MEKEYFTKETQNETSEQSSTQIRKSIGPTPPPPPTPIKKKLTVDWPNVYHKRQTSNKEPFIAFPSSPRA